MKKFILFSCLVTSLQSLAAPVFWGVDFAKDFEPNDFKVVESSASNFKYNFYKNGDFSYDYILKSDDPNFDYIGVILGDNHSEALSKRPFLVVGCTNKFSANQLNKVVEDVYVVNGQSRVIGREHSDIRRLYGVELVAYKFTASAIISPEHKSCLAVESKRNPNYLWKSKNNSELRSFYLSLPFKKVY